MSVGGHRSPQRRGLDSLQLELQVIMSRPNVGAGNSTCSKPLSHLSTSFFRLSGVVPEMTSG